MNALTMTGRALAAALATATREPTAFDRLDFRDYARLSILIHVDRETPLSVARNRVAEALARQKSKARIGHWSFDPNRAIALAEFNNLFKRTV